MSSAPPEEVNPYRAPVATISGATSLDLDSDIELTRRTYLNHEASVKSLGTLYYVAAFFAGLFAIFYALAGMGLIIPPSRDGIEITNLRLFMAIASVAALVGVAINAGLGYGLRHLQVWSRWVILVLAGLFTVMVVVGLVVMAFIDPYFAGLGAAVYSIPTLIAIYIFYLMYSAKGAMVFSPGYREVVRQTPHIRYRTSIVIKILLGLVIALISFGVIASIIANIARR